MPNDIETSAAAPPRWARSVLLGDRLAIDRSKYSGVVSSAPFCFRRGDGYVVIFRYGVVVLINLPAAEESVVLEDLRGDNPHTGPLEEERSGIAFHPEQEEGLNTAGIMQIKELSPAHALVLADVLAKSVALARYEKDIAAVFDTIEPEANALAIKGRIPKDRRTLMRMIGSALLTQHRVSGRIAFAEKPDILWDHPELERFYARLEDEYEIIERGTLLNGKMGVISTAAQTFTDLMDTARSARLEWLIIVLILAELIVGAAALFRP